MRNTRTRYRVVRCAQCELIYPHRKPQCTRCGAEERVGALVSAEDLLLAARRCGAPRRALVLPRGAPIHARSHPSLWRRILAWGDQRVPEWAGIFRRR